MKRAELLKKIAKEAKKQNLAWNYTGGTNHDVYRLDGLMIPIPRHREIGNKFAEAIYKECEPKLGKRWWK